jgi:hypothetical protein
MIREDYSVSRILLLLLGYVVSSRAGLIVFGQKAQSCYTGNN